MRNKWLIGGLIVSVIANLLLIGFVVGRLAGHPPMVPGGDPTMGYMRHLRALPEARREEVMPIVRGHMHGVWGDVRGIRRDQRALLDAIVAEPFDADALSAALERLQGRLTEAQSKSHAAFVAVVTKLTPEEREALADAMRRPPRKPPRP